VLTTSPLHNYLTHESPMFCSEIRISVIGFSVKLTKIYPKCFAITASTTIIIIVMSVQELVGRSTATHHLRIPSQRVVDLYSGGARQEFHPSCRLTKFFLVFPPPQERKPGQYLKRCTSVSPKVPGLSR
jgi:hypothetical protein